MRDRKEGKTKVWTFMFLLAVLVFSMYFVFADSWNEAPSTAGNGTIISPITFNVTNTSSVGGTTLNNVAVTLIGTASAGNLTNVTLSDGANIYFNDSFSSSPIIIDISAAITQVTNFTVNFTINSAATDSLTIGANVTAISNESNVSYSALPYTSNLTTIDSLEPNIQYGSGTASTGNFSQNFIFVNISVTDTVSNINTIIIYLYNSTAQVNSSTNSSIGATSGTHYINFTNLNDETYYINSTVNDTYNHINTSLSTRNIIIDTTLPFIAFGLNTATNASSVERTWIYVNVTVTETNERNITFYLYNSSYSSLNITNFTDSTRTINWTGLSAGGTVYYYNVTVRDFADNSNTTSTRKITLTSAAAATTTTTTTSEGGGGSNPSFWSKGTFTVSDEQLQQGYSRTLIAKQRLLISVDSETHYVGVKEVTSTNVKIEVTSTPQEKTLGIGEVWKVDVAEDNFYDLSVVLNSIVGTLADITVKSIHEEILQTQEPAGDEKPKEKQPTITGDVVGDGEGKKSPINLIILIAAILVALVIAYIMFIKKRQSKKLKL